MDQRRGVRHRRHHRVWHGYAVVAGSGTDPHPLMAGGDVRGWRGGGGRRWSLSGAGPACRGQLPGLLPAMDACCLPGSRFSLPPALQASTRPTFVTSSTSACQNPWRATSRHGGSRGGCLRDMEGGRRAPGSGEHPSPAESCAARAAGPRNAVEAIRRPAPPSTPPCARMQESGRAGRDGLASDCLLYYSYADAAKSRHMLRQSAQENNSPLEQLKSNEESLNAMVGRQGEFSGRGDDGGKRDRGGKAVPGRGSPVVLGQNPGCLTPWVPSAPPAAACVSETQLPGRARSGPAAAPV